jgi:hypothetical protein
MEAAFLVYFLLITIMCTVIATHYRKINLYDWTRVDKLNQRLDRRHCVEKMVYWSMPFMVFFGAVIKSIFAITSSAQYK